MQAAKIQNQHESSTKCAKEIRPSPETVKRGRALPANDPIIRKENSEANKQKIRRTSRDESASKYILASGRKSPLAQLIPISMPQNNPVIIKSEDPRRRRVTKSRSPEAVQDRSYEAHFPEITVGNTRTQGSEKPSQSEGKQPARKRAGHPINQSVIPIDLDPGQRNQASQMGNDQQRAQINQMATTQSEPSKAPKNVVTLKAKGYQPMTVYRTDEDPKYAAQCITKLYHCNGTGAHQNPEEEVKAEFNLVNIRSGTIKFILREKQENGQQPSTPAVRSLILQSISKEKGLNWLHHGSEYDIKNNESPWEEKYLDDMFSTETGNIICVDRETLLERVLYTKRPTKKSKKYDQPETDYQRSLKEETAMSKIHQAGISKAHYGAALNELPNTSTVKPGNEIAVLVVFVKIGSHDLCFGACGTTCPINIYSMELANLQILAARVNSKGEPSFPAIRKHLLHIAERIRKFQLETFNNVNEKIAGGRFVMTNAEADSQALMSTAAWVLPCVIDVSSFARGSEYIPDPKADAEGSLNKEWSADDIIGYSGTLVAHDYDLDARPENRIKTFDFPRANPEIKDQSLHEVPQKLCLKEESIPQNGQCKTRPPLLENEPKTKQWMRLANGDIHVGSITMQPGVELTIHTAIKLVGTAISTKKLLASHVTKYQHGFPGVGKHVRKDSNGKPYTLQVSSDPLFIPPMVLLDIWTGRPEVISKFTSFEDSVNNERMEHILRSTICFKLNGIDLEFEQARSWQRSRLSLAALAEVAKRKNLNNNLSQPYRTDPITPRDANGDPFVTDAKWKGQVYLGGTVQLGFVLTPTSNIPRFERASKHLGLIRRDLIVQINGQVRIQPPFDRIINQTVPNYAQYEENERNFKCTWVEPKDMFPEMAREQDQQHAKNAIDTSSNQPSRKQRREERTSLTGIKPIRIGNRRSPKKKGDPLADQLPSSDSWEEDENNVTRMDTSVNQSGNFVDEKGFVHYSAADEPAEEPSSNTQQNKSPRKEMGLQAIRTAISRSHTPSVMSHQIGVPGTVHIATSSTHRDQPQSPASIAMYQPQSPASIRDIEMAVAEKDRERKSHAKTIEEKQIAKHPRTPPPKYQDERRQKSKLTTSSNTTPAVSPKPQTASKNVSPRKTAPVDPNENRQRYDKSDSRKNSRPKPTPVPQIRRPVQFRKRRDEGDEHSDEDEEELTKNKKSQDALKTFFANNSCSDPKRDEQIRRIDEDQGAHTTKAEIAEQHEQAFKLHLGTMVRSPNNDTNIYIGTDHEKRLVIDATTAKVENLLMGKSKYEVTEGSLKDEEIVEFNTNVTFSIRVQAWSMEKERMKEITLKNCEMTAQFEYHYDAVKVIAEQPKDPAVILTIPNTTEFGQKVPRALMYILSRSNELEAHVREAFQNRDKMEIEAFYGEEQAYWFDRLCQVMKPEHKSFLDNPKLQRQQIFESETTNLPYKGDYETTSANRRQQRDTKYDVFPRVLNNCENQAEICYQERAVLQELDLVQGKTFPAATLPRSTRTMVVTEPYAINCLQGPRRVLDRSSSLTEGMRKLRQQRPISSTRAYTRIGPDQLPMLDCKTPVIWRNCPNKTGISKRMLGTVSRPEMQSQDETVLNKHAELQPKWLTAAYDAAKKEEARPQLKDQHAIWRKQGGQNRCYSRIHQGRAYQQYQGQLRKPNKIDPTATSADYIQFGQARRYTAVQQIFNEIAPLAGYYPEKTTIVLQPFTVTRNESTAELLQNLGPKFIYDIIPHQWATIIEAAADIGGRFSVLESMQGPIDIYYDAIQPGTEGSWYLDKSCQHKLLKTITTVYKIVQATSCKIQATEDGISAEKFGYTLYNEKELQNAKKCEEIMKTVDNGGHYYDKNEQSQIPSRTGALNGKVTQEHDKFLVRFWNKMEIIAKASPEKRMRKISEHLNTTDEKILQAIIEDNHSVAAYLPTEALLPTAKDCDEITPFMDPYLYYGEDENGIFRVEMKLLGVEANVTTENAIEAPIHNILALAVLCTWAIKAKPFMQLLNGDRPSAIDLLIYTICQVIRKNQWQDQFLSAMPLAKHEMYGKQLRIFGIEKIQPIETLASITTYYVFDPSSKSTDRLSIYYDAALHEFGAKKLISWMETRAGSVAQMLSVAILHTMHMHGFADQNNRFKQLLYAEKEPPVDQPATPQLYTLAVPQYTLQAAIDMLRMCVEAKSKTRSEATMKNLTTHIIKPLLWKILFQYFHSSKSIIQHVTEQLDDTYVVYLGEDAIFDAQLATKGDLIGRTPEELKGENLVGEVTNEVAALMLNNDSQQSAELIEMADKMSQQSMTEWYAFDLNNINEITKRNDPYPKLKTSIANLWEQEIMIPMKRKAYIKGSKEDHAIIRIAMQGLHQRLDPAADYRNSNYRKVATDKIDSKLSTLTEDDRAEAITSLSITKSQMQSMAKLTRGVDQAECEFQWIQPDVRDIETTGTNAAYIKQMILYNFRGYINETIVEDYAKLHLMMRKMGEEEHYHYDIGESYTRATTTVRHSSNKRHLTKGQMEQSKTKENQHFQDSLLYANPIVIPAYGPTDEGTRSYIVPGSIVPEVEEGELSDESSDSGMESSSSEESMMSKSTGIDLLTDWDRMESPDQENRHQGSNDRNSSKSLVQTDVHMKSQSTTPKQAASSMSMQDLPQLHQLDVNINPGLEPFLWNMMTIQARFAHIEKLNKEITKRVKAEFQRMQLQDGSLKQQTSISSMPVRQISRNERPKSTRSAERKEDAGNQQQVMTSSDTGGSESESEKDKDHNMSKGSIKTEHAVTSETEAMNMSHESQTQTATTARRVQVRNLLDSSCTTCPLEVSIRPFQVRPQQNPDSTIPKTPSAIFQMLLDRPKWSFADAHCHYDYQVNNEEFWGSFKDYKWIKHAHAWSPAFRFAITNFVNPLSGFNDDETQWEDILRQPDMFATYGLHPKKSKQWTPRIQRVIEQRMTLQKVKAVGECGLDDFRSDNSRMRPEEWESQIRVFKLMIDVAINSGKALVLHIRGSPKCEDTAFDILKSQLKGELAKMRIHRHFYTQPWSTTQRWMRAFPNMHFGFTSAIFSIRSSHSLYETIVKLPANRILIETDAPYVIIKEFTVPPYQVLNNQSSMAGAIGLRICQYRNEEPNRLMPIIFENTRFVYDITDAELPPRGFEVPTVNELQHIRRRAAIEVTKHGAQAANYQEMNRPSRRTNDNTVYYTTEDYPMGTPKGQLLCTQCERTGHLVTSCRYKGQNPKPFPSHEEVYASRSNSGYTRANSSTTSNRDTSYRFDPYQRSAASNAKQFSPRLPINSRNDSGKSTSETNSDSFRRDGYEPRMKRTVTVKSTVIAVNNHHTAMDQSGSPPDPPAKDPKPE